MERLPFFSFTLTGSSINMNEPKVCYSVKRAKCGEHAGGEVK